MKKTILVILLIGSVSPFSAVAQLTFKIEEWRVHKPIDTATVRRTETLLDHVFNLKGFKDSLRVQRFVCSNKPELCPEDSEWVSGQQVYDQLYSYDTLKVRTRIKFLWNPWKRFISGTRGETMGQGYSIITYNWWLKRNTERETLIQYASHVGHELFHTRYFQYIHDPEYGSDDFVNDLDICYKIDDLLEYFIRKSLENPDMAIN